VLSGLRRILTELLPEKCFLPGTRIAEKQRVFSIRPGTGEAALGLRLEPLQQRWPAGRGICDAVFICASPQHNNLIISLIELKGGNRERALVQIKDSCELLCRGATAVLSIHREAIIREVAAINKTGHGNGLLGVVLSKQGLTLTQKEKATLWRDHRLRIWPRTGQLREISCSDLAAQFQL